MKLPSLEFIATASFHTVKRFPLSLLCSFLAGSAAIYLVGIDGEGLEWKNLILSLSLGFPFYLSLETLLETSSRGKSLRAKVYLSLTALLLILGYWYFLNRAGGSWRYIQYAHMWVIMFCCVSVSPFTTPGRNNAFWQYNRRLLTRLLLSAFYLFVFFGGLSLALAAFDKLFGVHIDGDHYKRLWLFGGYFFFSWHFLTGIPTDIEAMERDQTYPKALRIFAQYMLLPLFVLYLLILYLYMGKILLEQKWPAGWVGWLVSYASAFGMWMLLLLYPEKKKKETRWIHYVERGFYISILPLLVLLFVAVYKRLVAYDFTEMRYFLLGLGVWFFGLSIYMLAAKSRDIKIIPMSLFLAACVACFGPWGAYQVSRNRQAQRLERVLAENHLLSNGKVVKSNITIPFDKAKDISGMVDYLAVHYGARTLEKWSSKTYSDDTDASVYNTTSSSSVSFLAEMGLRHIGRWENEKCSDFSPFRIESEWIACDGYRRFIPIHDWDGRPKTGTKPVAYIYPIPKTTTLEIVISGQAPLTVNYAALVEKLGSMDVENKKVENRLMALDCDPTSGTRLILTQINLRKNEDGVRYIRNLSGYLLMR